MCGAELPMGATASTWASACRAGCRTSRGWRPLVKKRTANNAKDDPHVACLPDTFVRAYGLPHLLKFVQTPGLLVMLNEMNAGYRQVFLDGRPFPVDPTPSWQGYSSAKWEGDTLVVNSIGFRDDLWIDWNGSVITRRKVQERIRRPDYGHLEIECDRRRSEGLHQAVDRHAAPADRAEHRARGRDLPGEREVVRRHVGDCRDGSHKDGHRRRRRGPATKTLATKTVSRKKPGRHKDESHEDGELPSQ